MCYVLYEKNNKKHLFLFGGTKIKHYICITKQILKVMIVINRTIAAAITDSIDGNHGSFSIEVGIPRSLCRCGSSFCVQTCPKDTHFSIASPESPRQIFKTTDFDIVTTNEILDCQSQEIQIVPDSEFLGGGKRSGQCDGWSYHIELI